MKKREDWDYLKEKEQWLEKETMSVKDFIDLLKKYPPEMKVMSTWESTVHSVKKENIYISHTNRLFIDSDENFYKKEFAKDIQENELEKT